MKLLINENEPITNEHNLKYKIVDNKVIITGVDSDVTYIEIPDEIEEKPVTKIADNAFYSNTNLVYVKLGSNIKTLGQKAFAGSSIKEITIPSSVKSVETNCFENCKNLYSVKWETNCEIPYTCFGNCVSLKSFDFSKTKGICAWAFAYSGLTYILIPNNVEFVEQASFYKCKMLSRVTWKANNYTIQVDTFEGCTNLEKFNFSNVSVIESYAFSKSGLKEIDLSNNTKKVYNNAFCDCENLKEVTWDCPCVIPIDAFAGCYNLEDVYITSANAHRYTNFVSEDAFDKCEKVQIHYIN